LEIAGKSFPFKQAYRGRSPAIVEQHGPCVWRTAYRLLSDCEEASDCYQETFLKAVEYSRQKEIANWASLLKRIR